MKIRSLALLALVSVGAMSVNAFADETPFARVRNYGQEYTGFEYRVNTETGEGYALLGFRELVDYPGPCPNPGYCAPTWRYRYSTVRATVSGLSFDAAANRITFVDPVSREATLCANTEVRSRLGRNVLYIYPTGDCRVLASRSRRTYEFYFEGK